MTGFQEAHTLGFPVFCLAFTPSRSRLLIGGGGGATKAGVKNALLYFDVNESQGGLEPLGELLFSKLEDGCMSVAVHPTVRLPSLEFYIFVRFAHSTLAKTHCRWSQLSRRGNKSWKELELQSIYDEVQQVIPFPFVELL